MLLFILLPDIFVDKIVEIMRMELFSIYLQNNNSLNPTPSYILYVGMIFTLFCRHTILHI